MTVWHVGQSTRHALTDGVNAVVWLLAAAQAEQGVGPVLVNRRPLEREARAFAEAHGIRELTIPALGLGVDPRAVVAALKVERPRLVHVHSVFVPYHAFLSRVLKAEGVPYVVTPHGGVSATVLARGRMKKALYAALLERRRFEDACVVTAVSAGEVDEIRAFAPRCPAPVPIIPNPVEVALLEGEARNARAGPRRPVLTFLGRFDVHLKGLDRLYDIAKLLPEVDVHLVGAVHRPSRAAHAALDRHRPVNLSVSPPLYGAAKADALRTCTMYVQMSRSEAFGIAVAEAMSVGTPVAVSVSMHLAAVIERAQAGLVLSVDPARAAEQLREALADPERLVRWGRNARAYATKSFHPRSVANAYLDVYDDVA